MTIAICDDEKNMRNKLVQLIRQHKGLRHRVITYQTGEALLFDFFGEQSIDLIFLDIEMPSGHPAGLEIAAKIREKDKEIPIVFLTAHDKYAVAGYEHHPYHYLLKSGIFHSINNSQFFYVLDEIEEQIYQSWNDYYSYPSKDGWVRIRKKDILFVERMQRITYIHTHENTYKRSHIKISDMLLELCGERFFSPHQSFIINVNCLHKITDGGRSIRLWNGQEVPIARGRKEMFINYVATYTIMKAN